MIHFEINQRVGKKIKKTWLSKIVKKTLRAADVKEAVISIAVVGDQEMKKLNKMYRGKNRVTDVLSFNFRVLPRRFSHPSVSTINGEIIICYPQAVRQAKERGHGVEEEIKLLLVHGLLHLCGYEHEKDEKEARRMKRMEQIVLSKLQ